MEGIAQRLTRSFLRRGIITPDQTEWCCYTLENRLVQWSALIIMTVAGTLLAGFVQTVLFLWAVRFLRRRTNGYHAQTFWECLIKSLLCEVICLLLAPWMQVWALVGLLAAGSVVVVVLAPVNNSNMHFDQREMDTLRHITRRNLVIADVVALALLIAAPPYGACVVLALCVVAVLLLLAKLGFGVQ